MDSLLARLGLALAIGLLVGLERGWRERHAPDRSRTAGIRTFGLSGLLGGVVAALAGAAGAPYVLAGGFVAFAAIFAWYKMREAAHDKDFSVTGVVAGLGVFALGALAVAGDHRAAAAGGAALAAVLASREVLHGLLRRLTWIELRSALTLAVMTAIILPLLPNRAIDSWNGFNPWEVWFFTVLTASISFLGYIAVRLLGEARGLLVSSAAGAIVSSTAVTVALARTAGTGGKPLLHAGAASIAAMVSVLRVSAIVLLIEPRVFATMGMPALAAAAGFAASGALLLARGGGPGGKGTVARNPFELGPLLIFAAFFAVVATASAALSSRFGGSGLIGSTILSAGLDVDVAVLSALRLVQQQMVSVEVVGQAVLAALATNAVGRLSLAILAGPMRFWFPLAGANLLAAAAGYGALVILLWT